MTGQKYAVAFAVAICALGSTAGAQISYVSQTRTATAATNTVTAPDFGPFEQTVSWSASTGGCAQSADRSALATHMSELSESSIAFSLRARARTGNYSAEASLVVTFTVPPGSAFTLEGERLIGGDISRCCGYAFVTLVGPGVEFDAQPGIVSPPETIPFEASGMLAGGEYTLTVRGTATSSCWGGFPTTGEGKAIGTLTVTPPRCRVDWDSNGEVNPADVAAFVSAWISSLADGTLVADFDGNAAIEPADVATFVQAWFAALAGGPC